MIDNDSDICGCDVCASIVPINQMTPEARQAYLDQHWPATDVPKPDVEYVEELEAENERLLLELQETERLARTARPTCCPRCDLDLTQDEA